MKTHRSARRISIPQECVTSLRWYTAASSRTAAKPAMPGATSAWCSPASPAGRSTPPTYTATTTPSATSPDVRKIRFHDLRHSAASLLLEQGVELVVVKDLLGHAQINTTADIYAHVRLRLQRQAIEAMGQALHDPDDDDDEAEPDDPPILVPA